MDFAQFRASAADLPGPDEAAAAHTRAREATLTKPPGSLGRLEALAEWAARVGTGEHTGLPGIFTVPV